MNKKILASIMLVAVLSACSSTSETLFGGSVPPSAAASDSDNFGGTFMRQRIANSNAELTQLKDVINGRRTRLADMRAETNTAVNDYRTVLSGISTRLQQGTTPGNPELMDQWRIARSKLERINEIAFDIKRLGAEIDSDSSMIDYMNGSIQAAYKIRGASEDDHKTLKTLEDEVRVLAGEINTLSSQIDRESERQQEYVGTERARLNDLALSIRNGRIGPASANTSFMVSEGASMFSSDEAYSEFREEANLDYGPDGFVSARPSGMVERTPARGPRRPMSQAAAAPTLLAPASAPSSRPITTVTFDRADVDFKDPLYQALSRALERNPAATFEVAGISPRGKDAETSRYVRGIVGAMTDMGLPANRIAITNTTGDIRASEVRVFERN